MRTCGFVDQQSGEFRHGGRSRVARENGRRKEMTKRSFPVDPSSLSIFDSRQSTLVIIASNRRESCRIDSASPRVTPTTETATIEDKC